ncbi:MAG: hypothetical protein ACO3RV_05365 [Luteolibacter sp.]
MSNTFNLIIDYDPITDGDISTDISYPQWIGICGVSKDGAPSTVDSADPARSAVRDRLSYLVPSGIKMLVPAEQHIRHHRERYRC